MSTSGGTPPGRAVYSSVVNPITREMLVYGGIGSGLSGGLVLLQDCVCAVSARLFSQSMLVEVCAHDFNHTGMPALDLQLLNLMRDFLES